jgi:hypothetical protein
MSLGICPVAGSAKRMRSQTTRSAGLSDANATIDFLFSVQEEKIANPIAKSKILFIF